VVAADSTGHAHVAWTGRPATSTEIFYAMLDGVNGAARIAVTQLTPGDGFNTGYPSIGVGPGGAVTLVVENFISYSYFGIRPVTAVMRIDPSLDDQDGSAADSVAVTTLALKAVSSISWSSTMLPSAAVDAAGNSIVCYFGSYTTGRGSLQLVAVDATGNPVGSPSGLTEGTSATTTLDFTRPAVAVGNDTAAVVWTDDRWGAPEVLLQFLAR
jgi:hypothetical protein